MKQDEVVKEEVGKEYDEFQAEHGNLNQLSERPLLEKERAYLKKQLNLNYGLSGVAMFLSFGGIIWIYLYGGDMLFIYLFM